MKKAAMTTEIVITTMGKNGSSLYKDSEYIEINSYEAIVKDTTGAGDAFTAGLLHRWVAPVAERLRFAAACGALVCAGAGGIDPQPTEAQVDAFLGGVS